MCSASYPPGHLTLEFVSCSSLFAVAQACLEQCAGADLVNAHGKSQFSPMLQLFESYLDRKDVGDEARYDKVREGAVVFLGTLARHLDPSDAKVTAPACPPPPPPPRFPFSLLVLSC